MLRWLDPAGLLEQVQKARFERATTADFLRGEAALGLAADDPEEAAAVAETIADPADRAGTLVDLADATPTADRARKLALLDRAALQARAGGLSSNKLFQMGEVAERWLELGEAEKARALFAEGRKLVETLPPQKRTDAGSFLAHLSRVEPAVALALIENVGETRWRQRIYGNIAIRLAFEHPAEAEAMLNRIEESTWRIYGAPRICRRLAAKDLPRAGGSPPACPIPPNVPTPGRSWPTAWRRPIAPPPRPRSTRPCARSTRSIRAIDRSATARIRPARSCRWSSGSRPSGSARSSGGPSR